MKLLYANDAPGSYPASWYAASTEPLAPQPALRGELRADLAIVGAGFTGLSAALHAAEAGLSVVLIDAQRVGFGASGRNGGQLGTGQRQTQDVLEKLVPGDARALWDLGLEAVALVKALVARVETEHATPCHLRPGVAWVGNTASDGAHLQDYARHLNDRYGYEAAEALTPEEVRALCPSPAYHGGMIDRGAGHLHPLAFCLGLARACLAAGVRIFERTEVLGIEPGRPARLRCAEGGVTADHVILACNGYLDGLEPRVARKVMPINNFVVATAPLEDPARVLSRDVAVADSKFVVNYFRLSHDNRLLFGGGESYGYRFPADIAAKVRGPMTEIFPHLADVPIDHAWGGTLGITMKRLPYLARLAPNLLTASGYSGHGVGTATHAGMLMARAIAGEAAGFDTMGRMPVPSFPGGAALRSPLLVLAMTWFSLRDRLGI